MAAFVYHLIRRHTLNFSITYKISIEFQMEIKIICHRGFGHVVVYLRRLRNVQSLKRTCWAIVLPTRSFVFLCPRCRRRCGLLKVPILKSHNVRYYKLEVGSRPMETIRPVVFTIWQLWSKISAYKEETSSHHKLTAVQQFIGWTEYNRKDVQVAQCKKFKWPDKKFLPGFQD